MLALARANGSVRRASVFAAFVVASSVTSSAVQVASSPAPGERAPKFVLGESPENDLVLAKERFRETLLEHKGHLIGRDARYTGPAPGAGERAVDPSASLSPPFVAAADWDYGGARSPFTDDDFASAVSRANLPRDRVTLRQYEGGHMFYTNASALATFADDLRRFVVGSGLEFQQNSRSRGQVPDREKSNDSRPDPRRVP